MSDHGHPGGINGNAISEQNTYEEVLATFDLVLIGPPVTATPGLGAVTFSDELLREIEENLTEILPDKYRVEISEWSGDD